MMDQIQVKTSDKWLQKATDRSPLHRLKRCIEQGCSTPAVKYYCEVKYDQQSIKADCEFFGPGSGIICTIEIKLWPDHVTLRRTGGGLKIIQRRYPRISGKYILWIIYMVQQMTSEVLTKHNI